jgi:hypothetical protein
MAAIKSRALSAIMLVSPYVAVPWGTVSRLLFGGSISATTAREVVNCAHDDPKIWRKAEVRFVGGFFGDVGKGSPGVG